MPVVAEAKFPTVQLLSQAVSALKELDPQIKFEFSSGETDEQKRKGIIAKLRDETSCFVCEYYLSEKALLAFEIERSDWTFTFDANELLKLLKHAEKHDRVTLSCDDEKTTMAIKIEHFNPPPQKVQHFELNASDVDKELVGSPPPMEDLRAWPFVQMDTGSLLKNANRLADVIKCRGGAAEKIIHMIASKSNVNMVHEDDEANIGFQVKWREDAEGPEMLANRNPVHTQSMGNNFHEGWYNVHYFQTAAKGGKQIAESAVLMFPSSKEMAPMVGFLFRVDDAVEKAKLLDDNQNKSKIDDINDFFEEEAMNVEDEELQPRELIFQEDDPRDRVIGMDEETLMQAPEDSNPKRFGEAKSICQKIRKIVQAQHKAKEVLEGIAGAAGAAQGGPGDGLPNDLPGGKNAQVLEEEKLDAAVEMQMADEVDVEGELKKAEETLREKIHGKLTIKQLQELRDVTKGGPLDHVVIAACAHIAKQYPEAMEKMKQKMLNRETKYGYLTFFCQSQDAPKLNEFDDSDDEEEEADKREKWEDYYIWDRRKFLGAEHMYDREKAAGAGGAFGASAGGDGQSADPMDVDNAENGSAGELPPEFVMKG